MASCAILPMSEAYIKILTFEVILSPTLVKVAGAQSSYQAWSHEKEPMVIKKLISLRTHSKCDKEQPTLVFKY